MFICTYFNRKKLPITYWNHYQKSDVLKFMNIFFYLLFQKVGRSTSRSHPPKITRTAQCAKPIGVAALLATSGASPGKTAKAPSRRRRKRSTVARGSSEIFVIFYRGLIVRKYYYFPSLAW
jgi:hypothetical protein